MNDFYVLEEFVELIDKDWRTFYTKQRLAEYSSQTENQPRTLNEWDEMFKDYVEGRRYEMWLAKMEPIA